MLKDIDASVACYYCGHCRMESHSISGVENAPGSENELQLGSATTTVDNTGDAMSGVSEWTKKRRNGNNSTSLIPLPCLILVTAKGNPLLDGGLGCMKRHCLKKKMKNPHRKGFINYKPEK